MGMIKLDHWYIKNNQLCISLMKYYTNINMVLSNSKVFFVLNIVNLEMKELYLCFNTLEEAITFVEDVINKDYEITFSDMEEVYRQQYSDEKVLKKTKNL